MYDPAIGRWAAQDPLSEKYYSFSAYNYCVNNPVMFVDLDGRAASPIYDTDGNLLGTDDNGLQGESIIMNREDFKQGMSHFEALEKNLGVINEGLVYGQRIAGSGVQYEINIYGSAKLKPILPWLK